MRLMQYGNMAHGREEDWRSGEYAGVIHGHMSIEKCWYRIMTELDEDYLFPPEAFEIVRTRKAIRKAKND